LEAEKVEYESVGEFLAEIKKEFGEGDEESLKVAELKRIEQGGRTMEEFEQDFKRVIRGSSYEECLLIEEFKWGMNRVIRRKLMECYNRCLLKSTWTWVKGMIIMISCAEVVSVSTSCSRHCNLT